MRYVTRGTLLAGKYLLRKDGVVRMPRQVIHADVAVWGPSAREFDPRRFVKPEAKGSKEATDEVLGGVGGGGGVRVVSRAPEKPTKLHPAAFRAFGGGSTLCPGRFFATTEIVSVAAMFLLRFDSAPGAGGTVAGGTLVLPTRVWRSLTTSIQAPVEDVTVRVSRRGREWRGGRWVVGRRGC